MIRTKGRLRLCTILLVVNLAFIWGNSLMPAEVSHAFSEWVKAILARFLSGNTPVTETGSGLLRKMAHFLEFGALGCCLTWRSTLLRKKFKWTFLSGVAVAVVDEAIQCFVPARGASAKDVLLDCSGVLTGMLLMYLGHTILKKRKTK